MCFLCAATRPTDLQAEFDTHAGGPARTDAASPSQLNQIADYLVSGFWNDKGEDRRSFNVNTGGTVTYDVTGLSKAEKLLAVSAMQAWSDASGLKFKAANTQLSVKDEGSDARGSTSTTDTLQVGQKVNGAISGGSDVDFYRVTLKAGIDYFVELKQIDGKRGDLDVILELRDSAGNIVTSSDGPDARSHEAVAFNVSQDGTYFLRAASFNNTDGAYALSLEKAADLMFVNGDEGAYSYSDIRGQDIQTSVINVDNNWGDRPASLDSYWFQTYIHEIGHALGLGHAGNYNGNATFGPDHKFNQDSWQATVMSYFAQSDNPNENGSFAFLASTMPADIIAIRDIYGDNVQTRGGNSTYGADSNIGGYLRKMFEAVFDKANMGPRIYSGNPISFTIIDSGGRDTINLAPLKGRQVVNLNEFEASSIAGGRGNMLIGPDTVIENAIGGRAADVLLGNDVGNSLQGRKGGDRLTGNSGDDTLGGGDGGDTLNGGAGTDTVLFNGRDRIRVNLTDTNNQNTGQGKDTLKAVENVTSGSGDDRLIGNGAANRLSAGAGKDTLAGGGGNDTLIGGKGDDTLNGQSGDDSLVGGGGRDRFVFAEGSDLIADFQDNLDVLVLDLDLIGQAGSEIADILALAQVVGDSLVFEFASGARLTLAGITDASILANDLILT